MPIEPEIDDNADDEILLTDLADEGEDDEVQGDDTDGEPAGDDVAELPTFGDEEAEAETQETPAIRAIREELRATKRELKRYKSEIPPPPKIELPPKPVWGEGDEWEFEPERYQAARDAWDEQKAQYDASEAQRRAADEEQNREGNAIFASYKARAAKLPAALNYAKAAESVEDDLGTERAGLLLAAFPANAEVLIHALHKSPAKLKALEAVKSGPQFVVAAAKLMAQLEGKTMGSRKAPAPDVAVRGDAGNSGAAGDKKLEALEKEAAKTGNRSKIVAYKAAQRAA